MNKWKAAVYLRLSIDDGDKIESNSISNQKIIVNTYLKNEKDIKIKDYYIDDGFSGTSFDRPDFQRLIKDIGEGKINTIIVKDLSRLGRNYIETGKYIEEFFPEKHIRFIAINDNIDSFKDPKSVNNIIVPFKNLLNDEYARDISNKVKSVLDTKRENGEFIGSFAPYGYLRDERNKHKFVVDKKTAPVVKKIFKLILNGKSRKEVSDELNALNILPPAAYKMNEQNINMKKNTNLYKWNSRKIDSILSNQEYTGDLVQRKLKRISHKIHKQVRVEKDKWIIIPNHHVAIISLADFEKVQSIVYSRDTRINRNTKLNLFAGHLKCGICGSNLSIVKSNKENYYYCTSHLRNKGCKMHSIKEKDIEKIVLELINKQIELNIDTGKAIKFITEKENINYDLEILNIQREETQNNLLKYNNLKNVLQTDFENNYISENDYKDYDLDYSNKIKSLLQDKKRIEYKIKNINSNSSKDKILCKYNDKIEKLNKTIIDELIDYIYVFDKNKIKINFKFEDEFRQSIEFIKRHRYNENESNVLTKIS